MKTANLNYLFIDMINSYAHLITIENQTREQFAENVKNTYSLSEPRNSLFYQSILRSDFDTIRLDETRESVLLNQ